jgi:hypothetical protein
VFLPPFEAPELKIERARQHYTDVLITLMDYQAIAGPHFVKTSRDTDPWQVEVMQPVPSILALQLGDIAHSLRSALDVTMCDIALLRGVGLSDMTFPFATDEARFLAMLADSNKKQPFKKLGEDIVGQIKAARPYGDGNELLRGLHDLNNHDKHRMSVPIASFVSTTSTFSGLRNLLGIEVVSVGGPLVGLDIGVPLRDDPYVGDPREAFIFNPKSIIVTFPRDYVLRGEIADVMGRMIDEVDSLISRFKQLAMPNGAV